MRGVLASQGVNTTVLLQGSAGNESSHGTVPPRWVMLAVLVVATLLSTVAAVAVHFCVMTEFFELDVHEFLGGTLDYELCFQVPEAEVERCGGDTSSQAVGQVATSSPMKRAVFKHKGRTKTRYTKLASSAGGAAVAALPSSSVAVSTPSVCKGKHDDG